MKQNAKISILLIAALIPLFYAIYTAHVWEDYYITFKFSKNLAEGKGLVYNLGEKVHGFTSPLGVLLPAFTYFISGSDLAALWLFRIFFTIPAFVGAVYFLIKTCEKIFKENILVAYFCVALFALDAKSVMFSVNGMETAFMLLFLSWMINLAICGMSSSWLALGSSWAGLMWTRPDSCVYIVAFVVASLIFLSYSKKELFAIFAKAALICALLYLPWFIWAWIYYGSPIPHTILAKRVAFLSSSSAITIWQSFGFRVMGLIKMPSIIFYPAYPQFGIWPVAIYLFAVSSGFFVVLAWLAPLRSFMLKTPLRFLSFYFFLLCVYFAYIQIPYPWYLPPASFIGIIVLCGVVVELTNRWYLNLYVRNCILVLLLLFFISIFFLELERMKTQQDIVENGNRKQIGLWLKDNAAIDDKVYLECLGYIGYFSERKMLDFPGLVSPEVVKIVSDKKNGYVAAVETLMPDWVVAREFEARRLTQSNLFRQKYSVEKEFNVRDKISEQKHIFGINYLYYDSMFYVFKKKQETN